MNAGASAAPPAAAPRARPVVVVTALTLASVAALCVHELLARADLVGTPPLAPGLARAVDGHSMSPWVPWAAGSVALLGLLVLAAAVWPRRRTHLPACGGTLWLRPTDVARLCSAAALAQPGVADARTRVTRRRVEVTARPAPGAGAPGAAVEAAVAAALADLDSPPPLRVRLADGSRS